MAEPAIIIENLGKSYQLGHGKSGNIRETISNLFKKNNYKSESFWALKDINLTFEKGDAVGIIGRNGAGKSTLLKILSRITSPSTGRFVLNGRVSSLLEVGTGFHPELTGRENIYLNGTILGMTRAEVKSKLDEIVAFSGIEKFIDTPVKRYSSGMYVRLAFAVAAHLEPEILIVDEVLAVGDAEFQRKCLGKMKEVSANDGRTVLFVSHNMAAVQKLCNRGVLLNSGILLQNKEINEVINDYHQLYKTSFSDTHLNSNLSNQFCVIKKFEFNPLNGKYLSISSGFIFEMEMEIISHSENLALSFFISTADGVIITELPAFIPEFNSSSKGSYYVKFELMPYLLNSGIYQVDLILAKDQRDILFRVEQLCFFEIENEFYGETTNRLPGILSLRNNVEIKYIDL